MNCTALRGVCGPLGRPVRIDMETKAMEVQTLVYRPSPDRDLREVEHAVLNIWRWRNALVEAEEKLRKAINATNRQLTLPGI